MVKWRAKAKPGASRWGCGATIASFAASAEEAEDLAADFSETSAIVTTPYVLETASRTGPSRGCYGPRMGTMMRTIALYVVSVKKLPPPIVFYFEDRPPKILCWSNPGYRRPEQPDLPGIGSPGAPGCWRAGAETTTLTISV